MSNRLFSDLLSGTRRYFSALTEAPGVITPAAAQLSLLGRGPIAVQPSTVFRTPAPAALSMQGLSLASPVILSPAPALLTSVGQIPSEGRLRIITPALPAPVETPPTSFAPTLLTLQVLTPATAALTLIIPAINITQGGNIGFAFPGVAALSLSTLAYTLLYGETGVGALGIQGLAPTLLLTGTVNPDVGALSTVATAPSLKVPFHWVDDAQAPASAWITDRAA